ncbi:MAG TPA: hypothetical protein VJ754_04705, partial [Anaerolineae bacterium]|nr:hypothetical protein [Anaerolineae bacterium]
WQSFFAVGIGPGLIGLIVLLRREWRIGGMLALMFFFGAGFYIDYRVIDKDTMFLPAYVIWTLWLGVGYQQMLGWIQQGSEALTRRWGRRLLYSVMVGAVLFAAAWNWRLVDLSGDWSARTRGEAILRAAAPNALILGWWDSVPPIEYLQLVEGQRPDVQAINRFLIAPDAMRQLIQREAARRPVYIDSVPEELLAIAEAEATGPVYRLRPRE